MDLEILKKTISEGSEEKLNTAISEGALKLTPKQIATVSFMFWFIYMAETDLNTSITRAWKLSSEAVVDPLANEIAKSMLRELVFEKKKYEKPIEDVIANLPAAQKSEILGIISESYKKKPELDVENPEYFIDKIRIYEAMVGKNGKTKILWILNGLRNHVSHNRINELMYNGKPLADRKTKEELMIDYFESTQAADHTQSEFWKNLSPEEKVEIEKKYKEITKQSE